MGASYEIQIPAVGKVTKVAMEKMAATGYKTDVTLPMLQAPTMFPLDQASANFDVVVESFDDVQYLDSADKSKPASTVVSVRSDRLPPGWTTEAVAWGGVGEGQMNDMDTYYYWSTKSGGNPDFIPAAQRVGNPQLMEIGRPAWQVGIIFGIAVAPILLFLAWCAGERASTLGLEINAPSSLELAAALLALLGLRQILVPSDVGGLTLLDMILALEITIIVSVSASVYTLKIKTTRHLPAHTGETGWPPSEPDLRKSLPGP